MFTMLRHVLSLDRYDFLTCVSCSQIMSAKNGGGTPLPPWSANVSIYQTPLLTLSADVSICPAPSFRLVSLISICPACTLNLNDQKNTKKLQWFIQFTKLFRSVWKRSCFFSAVIICMSPSPLCQSMSPFARYFIPPLSANSSIYQTPSSPFGCWHKLWTHPKAQIRKQTAPSDFQGTQTVFRQGEELLIATNHADT